MSDKFLGMVMTPLDVQLEGLAAVMDRIAATGATAIDCGRSLNLEAPAGEGHRAPPVDIDGTRRVFDRPVWGKRELQLYNYAVDEPDLALYEDTPYKPSPQPLPTELDRDIPTKIYEDARRRGWKVYNSTSPLVIPGLKDEDQMRWVDGAMPDPQRRVARQGCPNAPQVRAYAIARVLDTIGQDPQIDGICLDWLEFTTYLLEDHFLCFCDHCRRHMGELGYDPVRIEEDALILWDHLHQLTPSSLAAATRMSRSPGEVLELFTGHPGWLDLLRFKADAVRLAFTDIRRAMDQSGYGHVELVANGWAPPFNRSSGMDYARLPGAVQIVRPKLYTFHWSAMPRWYGQVLQAWNPELDESALIEAVKHWCQLPDANSAPRFAHYNIPGPDEDHPVNPQTFTSRIAEVVDQVGGKIPVQTLAHGYRPAPQWREKVEIVRHSAVDGMWVQRYCYLSDEKLDILGQAWNS